MALNRINIISHLMVSVVGIVAITILAVRGQLSGDIAIGGILALTGVGTAHTAAVAAGMMTAVAGDAAAAAGQSTTPAG